jgi:hypothetical protein
MRKVRVLASAIALSSIAAFSQAAVLLYVNFDGPASGVQASGTEYTLTAPEVDTMFTTPTRFFCVANGVTDGPNIAAPPGGMTGTPQGGKALLLQSGGIDEGILAIMDGPLAKQKLTIESVWFTDNLDPAGNTVGIQSVIGDEWPSATRAQLFLRTIGNSVPGRNGRAEFWTDRGDSNSERVLGTVDLAVNRWYHMAMVFDYVDDTNCTLKFYIDGVQQGAAVPYTIGTADRAFGDGLNAAIMPAWNFPPTPANPVTSFAIGLANGTAAGNGSDHRGLSGGIDAIAISNDALAPGSFVLPAGLSSVSDWTIY